MAFELTEQVKRHLSDEAVTWLTLFRVIPGKGEVQHVVSSVTPLGAGWPRVARDG